MIKAKNVRCHVGAQIGAEVLTSIDSEKHKCKLVWTPTGVFVIGKKTLGGKAVDPTHIPHSTISSTQLDPEDFERFLSEMEPKKLGRPRKED